MGDAALNRDDDGEWRENEAQRESVLMLSL
jgi:hypothetical protein